MGLDLTLIPITSFYENGSLGHQILQIERDHELFRKIEALPSSLVPKKFYTYLARDEEGNPHYGNTQETPYGKPLKAVMMKQLKEVGLTGPVGAFVQASPNEQKVALYWS